MYFVELCIYCTCSIKSLSCLRISFSIFLATVVLWCTIIYTQFLFSLHVEFLIHQPLVIDEKIKRDIKMIQMRNYLDPKRYVRSEILAFYHFIALHFSGFGNMKSVAFLNFLFLPLFLDSTKTLIKWGRCCTSARWLRVHQNISLRDCRGRIGSRQS